MMDCSALLIPYRQTNSFSNIVLDYIDQHHSLKPFFSHPPSINGIKKAIGERKAFSTNRNLLVNELVKQYETVNTSERVQKNIQSLLSNNTFTVCTAHQPAIFTGPLYFIYKILHAIKLADQLNEMIPENHFVPVFYMGSEDADLDELGHICVNGEKLEWNTKQTGAVGRMKMDASFIKLIERLEGELSVLPFGKEIIATVKNCYKLNDTIESGTLQFINCLFQDYGLIVLMPDNASFKKAMIPVFKNELLNQTASRIVEKTSQDLGALYKVQASPREINLFYLKEDRRERIVYEKNKFSILNTGLTFDGKEMLDELNEHPERFSPNVILRGIYQETILPNIAFIGGGGELAYWLQLKTLFENHQVPFPVLVLRNSFLLSEKKWNEKILKLNLQIEDFFTTENELLNQMVKKESVKNLHLNGQIENAEKLYASLKQQAEIIDPTLSAHVEALKVNAIKRMKQLEKKMLKFEKRKFFDQQKQIRTIKQQLFPNNGLQERVENFIPFYAKWGKDFMDQLYKHSLSFEQEFTIIQNKG